MRKIDTSYVTDTVAMPVKSGSIDHLQLSYQEALQSLANVLVGPGIVNNKVYILFGCVNSGSGSNYVISAGAVYYYGEVFLVDATTFTTASGQTAVANVVISYNNTNADPVTFTDGNNHNVHQIRKMVISSGVSGSTIADFSNFLQTRIDLAQVVVPSMPSNYTVTFDQDRSIYVASAPNSFTINLDFTNANPGAVVRMKWTFGAGLTVAINGPVGTTAIINDSGNLASAASNRNILYLLYCGKNENGYDEVSYTIKQA